MIAHVLRLRVSAQGYGSSQGKRVPSELPEDKEEAGLYRKKTLLHP